MCRWSGSRLSKYFAIEESIIYIHNDSKILVLSGGGNYYTNLLHDDKETNLQIIKEQNYNYRRLLKDLWFIEDH